MSRGSFALAHLLCSGTVVAACSGVLLIAFARAADFSHPQKTRATPSGRQRFVEFEEVRRHLLDAPIDFAPRTINGRYVSRMPKYITDGETPGYLLSAQVSALQARADLMVKQGNLVCANMLLKQCLASSPGNRQIERRLNAVDLARSKYFLRQGDLKNAIDSAREAIYFQPAGEAAVALLNDELRRCGVNPADTKARFLLGKELASQHKLAAALVEYQQSLKLAPSCEACIGLGNVFYAAGQNLLAAQGYRAALQLDPINSYACRQLGMIALASGDTVEASRNLSQALTLNSNDPAAATALINMSQKQIARTPASSDAHLQLARAFQLAGNLASAGAEIQTAQSLEPQNPKLAPVLESFNRALSRHDAYVALQSARALENDQQPFQARQKVDEGLAHHPDDVDLLLYKGQLAERMGDPATAIDSFQAVLNHEPQNAQASQALQNLTGLVPSPQSAPSAVTPDGREVIPPAAPEAPMELRGPIPPPSTQLPPRIPVSAAPPGVSDHIAGLSNFMVALRNQAMLQKTQINKTERAAKTILNSFGLGDRMESDTNPRDAGDSSKLRPAS